MNIKKIKIHLFQIALIDTYNRIDGSADSQTL